ncbi:MAG: lysylphosphatidylglycerol synthase transmembrane domain-containing protein [Acetobacter sp.]
MKRAIFYGKLCVGFGFLVLLFYFGILNIHDIAFIFFHPLNLVAAIVLVFAGMPLTAVRWRLLLNAQGISITFYNALKLTLVAGFFNVFLLGGVGGDGVRLWMAARILKGPFSRVAASAAVDRIFGLEALLLVAALSCLGRLPSANDAPFLIHLAQIVSLVAAGGLVGPMVVLALGRRPLAVALLARLEQCGKLGAFVAQLCDSFILYRQYPGKLAYALGLSLVGHACMVVGFTLLAAPVGSALTLWDYGFVLSVTQVASCFALIPGALGVSEGIFGYLTALLAHSPSSLANLFFGFRVVTALATAPGALVWLTSPFRQAK